MERVFAAARAGGRLVFTSVEGWCGGTGNMLFRIAALYAIGKRLGRRPCLEGGCARAARCELEAAFPNLQFFALNKTCAREIPIASVEFAKQSAQAFDDAGRLLEHENATTLQLDTSYLQNFRLFSGDRREIRALLGFSAALNAEVDEWAAGVWRTEEERRATKVCAHLRGTDFRTNRDHPLLPSTLDFALPAVRFVVERARNETRQAAVSVVLFGEDGALVHEVMERLEVGDEQEALSVHYAAALSPLGALNLAARHCDFFLLTAGGSTFGWWAAFLLPARRQPRVFFNARLFKPHRADFAHSFVERDAFPPEWRRLVLAGDGVWARVEQESRALPGRHI